MSLRDRYPLAGEQIKTIVQQLSRANKEKQEMMTNQLLSVVNEAVLQNVFWATAGEKGMDWNNMTPFEREVFLAEWNKKTYEEYMHG
jgi:hypothetical protein